MQEIEPADSLCKENRTIGLLQFTLVSVDLQVADSQSSQLESGTERVEAREWATAQEKERQETGCDGSKDRNSDKDRQAEDCVCLFSSSQG